MRASDFLHASEVFAERHLGSDDNTQQEMLETIGVASVEQLIEEIVPEDIRLTRPLALGPALTEREALTRLQGLASKNHVVRSLIGLGYYGCITPPVIQRNILENPGWYTQYTPYQAEISQGRLEALINFQTMVADLTGCPLANASLLDEGTAAAEAMSMCFAIANSKRSAGANRDGFFVSADCHPQTLEVIKTRAEPLGIKVVVGPADGIDVLALGLFGVLLQYPATDGVVRDLTHIIQQIHNGQALVVVATDLLALTMLKPPGEMGADIVVGSAQRMGVPMGAGGPHAGFMSTAHEYRRLLPGRIIGVSKDAQGQPAYRLALQTREQHIRRDKATSNICTAQVLLAVMAGAYAVYHGPAGLLRMSRRIHAHAQVFAEGMRRLGFEVCSTDFFDTVRVRAPDVDLVQVALEAGFNIRRLSQGDVSISFDELSTPSEVDALLSAFAEVFGVKERLVSATELAAETEVDLPDSLARTTPFLEHEVFSCYHSEHEMLRYLGRLQAKDLSLTHSMIPLGSCTMKLNATAEMLPVTWPEWGQLHPFAPFDQLDGYRELFAELIAWLSEITGFYMVSLQPNAGSQGEYTGLLVIRAYHHSRGEHQRNVCLIPTSAHGTNPASAVMAGMRVVPIKCDARGNIDLSDLEAKADQHANELAAVMITYPSTHGVFETTIREACEVVKRRGGRVYLDGANLNAQVGLARPGDFGADVCHLNLHKTFCIPHGGGGPGMGPIGVVEELAPFLPGHAYAMEQSPQAIGPVASAPYGSPSILPISWMYIAMMGAEGLKEASQLAILNANYMLKRLSGSYNILFTGDNGWVAHEFILDLRPFKKTAGIEVEDVAKRLIDFGFHAPTMSWPVVGTMMVEPTESESRVELDRFCEALLIIREEIRAIEEGHIAVQDSPLKHAPHTMASVVLSEFSGQRRYPASVGVFPAAWVRHSKFWPSVGRVDNAYGDRNLMCTCPPMDDFIDGGG